MDPSKSAFVRKSLAERFSNINMRKVQVSAQVTATITLLEVLSNCVHVVIWYFIATRDGYATLTQGMLFQFVILSYAFSINTGDNRSRVVDNGWANVFKHLLHCGNLSLQNDNQIQHDNNPTQNFPLQQRRKDRGIMSRSINTRQTNIVKPVSNPDECKENTNGTIYTISRKEHCLPSTSKHVSTLDLNVPIYDEDPCSSKVVLQNDTQSVSSEDYTDQSEEDCRISVRWKTISSMLSNVKNEKLYIHYFTRLLSVEDSLKNDYMSNVFSSKYLDTADLVEEEINDIQHSFTRDIESRIKMRTDMLNSIQFHERDEDMYQEFLERLITMEEDLIIDNC